MTFAFFRVRLDNGGGALSGPPPADGFVDPTPPTRYVGFADDARRDAKVRAHARWLRLEQLLASVGEVVGMRVVARSDNGPNAEEDFVEFVVTYEGSRGVYTTDETTGTLLEGELAVLRAVGRALGHDVDDLVVDPASPARRIVAATPVSGTVGERLAAVEGRTVVELKAGSVATAGAWTPAMLFRPGDLGGFWDFRPPYVFQDSAGTIPADIGDPVGFVRDLSGNGNHLTQSTTSYKPSVSTDELGVVLDGVDDGLICDPNPFGSLTESTAAYAFLLNDDGGNLYGEDLTGLDSPNRLGTYLREFNRLRFDKGDHAAGGRLEKILTWNDAEKYVISTRSSGTWCEVRINRAQFLSGNVAAATVSATGPLAFGNRPWSWGSYANFSGVVYAFLATNRLLDNNELKALESWMARRAGISP